MALADLLRTLREQAAEARAAELAAARSEADRLASESEAALARRRSGFLERAHREEVEVGQRALARAQAQSAVTVLAARDRLLARVRSAVERRIADAEGDAQFLATLAADAEEVVRRLPSPEAVVRVRAGLHGAVLAAVEGLEGVSVEVWPEAGTGLRAFSLAGDVEVDATLETRLVYAWPRLAVAVLAEVAR
jgi:vacuolar-type H+-ATPase subunit E/Vma4